MSRIGTVACDHCTWCGDGNGAVAIGPAKFGVPGCHPEVRIQTILGISTGQKSLASAMTMAFRR